MEGRVARRGGFQRSAGLDMIHRGERRGRLLPKVQAADFCGIAFALACVLLTRVVVAATIHVDDNGPGDPGPGNPVISDPLEDGSTAHPFDRIQEGIAAAVAGDTALVAPGFYGGGLNLQGKAITLRSAGGPANTVIDGGTLPIIACAGGEPRATLIEGFTIRNGNSSGFAGGIACTGSSPTIRGNWFRNNYGGGGGAISAISFSNPLIVGNVFEENNGAGGGAGVYCSDSAVEVRGNRFVRNVAELEIGGAMHGVRSTLVITDNEFVDNIGLGGAALHVFDCPLVDVRRNRFVRNDGVTLFAGFPGAVNWFHSSGILADNVFFANRGDLGGAVCIGDSPPGWRNNTIVGTRPSSGRGSNSAVFLHGESSLTIRSSIFWDNVPLSAIGGGAPGKVLVEYCDLQGGAFGAGNVDIDPGFVDLGGGDLHLRSDSPCRDLGDPALVAASDDADVDGHPRVVAGRVDIGADEFLRPGDLDFDGQVTGADRGLFVALLLGLDGNPQRLLLADLSGDGVLNGADIPPFMRADGVQ